MKVTLKDGWNLTDLGATIDSKIPETIGALAGAVTAIGAPGKAQGSGSVPLSPGLWRIEFDKTTGFANRLVGPIP